MKKLTYIIFLVAAFISTINAQTQSTANSGSGITARGAYGEVVEADETNKYLKIKTADGSVIAAIFNDKTAFKRVAPGAKGLEGATDIAFKDVAVGDRVYSIGKVAEDKKSVMSSQIIVMAKTDIAAKQERDRAEWIKRGVHGIITAIDPATKEIKISSRSRESNNITIVAASDKLKFRRYAQDSVKFSDAKLSSFSELKVGDQLRALGEMAADGTRFTAEEIVSGSFRMLAGTITAVDTPNNQLKLNDLQTKKEITVAINQDSTLRRIPAEFAERMAQRGMNRGERGGADSRPPGPPSEARRDGPPSGMGGGRGRMGDFQEMLERMPPVSINDLKPNDMIILSTTTNIDPSRATAIMLVAGVDPILKSTPQGDGGNRGSRGGGGGGMGFGGFDFGMGLP
jgi:co-chaperonin GroES (HSP10)